MKCINVSSKSKTNVYGLFDLFFKYGAGINPLVAFLFSSKYELEVIILPFIFLFIKILSKKNDIKNFDV